MNNNFTQPTKYPTRFKLRDGRNATVYALTNENSYIGTVGENNVATRWDIDGASTSERWENNLVDIPLRRTLRYQYPNRVGGSGSFLVTCNPDGSEPTIICEEELLSNI
jgi:hypothetical protein